MKYLLLLLTLFFLGCNQNATINHYNKETTHIPCLQLSTNDLVLQMQLSSLYHFTQECPYELQAAQKSGIVCNSNQNADKKALTNFPHGFFRLDLYGKKEGLIWSYYLDVDKEITQEMVKEGFEQLQKEFSLP